MIRRCFFALLLAALAYGQSDQIRRYRGNGFTFQLIEPQGWVIDPRFPQIAQFVMYERGQSWRNADSVVYVSLVPRESDETLEDFVEDSVQNFKDSCPLFDVSELDLKLKGRHRFMSKAYECTGTRYELASVTAVDQFFVLFVLSARDPLWLEKGREPYKRVLSSFAWSKTPKRNRTVPPGGR